MRQVKLRTKERGEKLKTLTNPQSLPFGLNEGVDPDGGYGQHGDFDHGVETAKVYEDDVDDVAPFGYGVACVGEVIGQGGSCGYGRHCQGKQEHQDAN